MKRMNYLYEVARRLLQKAGYTVLKGDIRKSIRENTGHSLPPAHLLSNARVCRDRYEVLHHLPTGGTAVEVGVAYGHYSRKILEVLKPEKFIAIDTFAFREGQEPWGSQLLRDSQCSHYEYYKRQFASYLSSGSMTIKQGLSWD